MRKIHVLDEHIANQIAAGEVVERPASVVKELVENSIDAGSTKIDVSIGEGGLQFIRIVDNGSGMETDDCEIAFQRHATSKISSGKDLGQIRSLGFRGEALPSISAVSKLECITSSRQDGLGRKLIIEGGELISLEETAALRGTDIEVKDLFYNTPARLKYMKTIQTELGHVSDYIYRLAMAHPKIAFTLRHNGKVLLQTIGNGDGLQAIAAIYGTTLAKSMLPIQGESLDYSISGYISKPEITRANRSAISTIINGRYVRNYTLVHAVLNAYHTLLPVHRFPLCVLYITMDPSLVDVNVHPSKLEVRFSKDAELVQFIQETIKSELQRQVLIPHVGQTNAKNTPMIQEQIDFYRPSKEVEPPANERQPDWSNKQPPPSVTQVEQWLAGPKEDAKLAAPAFPKLFPIGQMHGTYIVAYNTEGLFLIDQHAAHERIHYEYYYKQFGNPNEASQQLLVPIPLEFTAVEAEAMKRQLHLFEQVGVYLESFGGNTFLVRSHPHWMPEGEEKNIIEEMAEWIITENKSVDLAKLREQSAIMCSCKASIKANEYVSLASMEALLDKLSESANPYTCPHGRPIVVSFSTYELEKMFKRVM